MNQPFLSEADKAHIAQLQLNASPRDKVELEFALNDYQDLVSRIFQNCRDMGVDPAATAMGYLGAVAMALHAFMPEAKPGMSGEVAEQYGAAITIHYNNICEVLG